MELNKNLDNLIERAQELYDKINKEIFSLCKHCSVQDPQCGIPMEEKERLIAISNSLKEVQEVLVFLQKLELRHKGNISSALSQLDQSRTFLIEQINEYPNHERKLKVLEDLHSCLGSLNSNSIESKKPKTLEHGVTHFLVRCIGGLFNSRNWYSITHLAMKVLVISAGVSSSVYIHRTMINSEYKTTREKQTLSNMALPVLHGRG